MKNSKECSLLLIIMKNILASWSRFPAKSTCCMGLGSASSVCYLLKVGLPASKKFAFICFNERLLKMMKNMSCEKHFLFFRYLNLLSCLFGYVKKDFMRELWLILKFMMSQTGQNEVAIHILPNISRSKGNHAMKSGQLIELNMRNIFLGKSHAKRGAEASFMKNQSSSYLWTNSLKY